MLPEIYADRFGGITYTGNMVRIDLVSLSATETDAGVQQTAAPHHRVIMTPQGFLQSMQIMQELLQKLLDAGVVRREAAPEQQSPS